MPNYTYAQAYPLSLIRHKVNALDEHLYTHAMKLFLQPEGEWSKGWAKDLRAVVVTCTRLVPKSGKLDPDFWKSTLFLDADPKHVLAMWAEGDFDFLVSGRVMHIEAQAFSVFWYAFVDHATNTWLVPREVPSTQEILTFFNRR